MSAFDTFLTLTFQYEGGYQNEPDDPGNWTSGHIGNGQCLGTNFGISTAAYPDMLHHIEGSTATFPVDVRSLTRDQAAILYRYAYWQRVRCDELPAPLALCVGDCAVNMGVAVSVQCLQSALSVERDGFFGPATMAALVRWCEITKEEPEGKISKVADLACEFSWYRLERYLAGSWSTFGHSWFHRMACGLLNASTISAGGIP